MKYSVAILVSTAMTLTGCNTVTSIQEPGMTTEESTTNVARVGPVWDAYLILGALTIAAIAAQTVCRDRRPADQCSGN